MDMGGYATILMWDILQELTKESGRISRKVA